MITNIWVLAAIGVTTLLFFLASYEFNTEPKLPKRKHHSNYQPRKRGRFVKKISYPEVKELQKVSNRQWRRK